MTDLTYDCDDCEDTGKVTRKTYDPELHMWMDDGEEDCICVIERIEADKADAQYHDD